MMERILTNWPIKLLSLAFAVMLWLLVMGEQNTEVGYTVSLEIKNVPKGLIIASEVPGHIDVRLTGSRTLLANIQGSDLGISVDLHDAKPGITTFRSLDERLNLPRSVVVSRLSPSFVDIKLERVVKKEVPLRVVCGGSPAVGYSIEEVMAAPDLIEVEGAESEMKRVTEVETESVDVEGLKTSFSLTVPINYAGIYSRLVKVKTADVQVIIGKIPEIEQPQEPNGPANETAVHPDDSK
ncbi:MAG: CdaR family protein [Desulfuromonadaceae bacterium]|nr:CdaR family protein [Desulfuromonadaceae bacterium]